jgi:hypothetical protein
MEGRPGEAGDVNYFRKFFKMARFIRSGGHGPKNGVSRLSESLAEKKKHYKRKISQPFHRSSLMFTTETMMKGIS